MRLLSCRDAAPLLAANPFQMSATTARMRVRRNCRARKSELHLFIHRRENKT
jgi:hypothetical protein